MSAIRVRRAKPEDARAILEVHHSAVHETAAKDYAPEILAAWSPNVDEARIETYLAKDFPGEETYVAELGGEVAGFGVIVAQASELRAVYVKAKHAGRGVGQALLRELEARAAAQGCVELRMDSSVTAEGFYLAQGYKISELGTHALRGGLDMRCVRMRKRLGAEGPLREIREGEPVKRVTCAIIRHEGLVLLARRLPDDAQGGLWEFPGGKVDPGETEEQCLLRELDEELGIGVRVDSFFMRHRHPIRSGVLELVAFLCTMTSPPTRLEAHSEATWVEPGRVLDWDLMAADVGVGERLK